MKYDDLMYICKHCGNIFEPVLFSDELYYENDTNNIESESESDLFVNLLVKEPEDIFIYDPNDELDN